MSQDQEYEEDEDGNVVRKTNRSMSSLSDGSGLRYSEFSSARGMLASANKNSNQQAKPKRGKKRKANTKWMQKAMKERKTFKERRQLYLPK